MAKKLKPCPKSVIEAGALSVKVRLDAAALVDNIIKLRSAYKAAAPEVIAAGAKEMEMGSALDKLMEACRVEGLVGEAHNDLRKVLVACGFAEPTNEQIVAAWPATPIQPRGGGGGGGRGR